VDKEVPVNFGGNPHWWSGVWIRIWTPDYILLGGSICSLWLLLLHYDILYNKPTRRWDSERELFYDDIIHALQNTI